MERPRILLLCTANQCRSPMAEGLLRAMLAERGIDAEVGSAGLYPGGQPATDHAVTVLADRGIDGRPHRSRQLTEPEVDLAGADLVLCMERRHLQEAILADPTLRSRTFTLVDFARRADAAGPRPVDKPLRAWAAHLGSDRTRSDLLGVGDDAVADPVGRPLEAYELTVDRLTNLLERVVAGAFPAGARTSTA